MARPRPQFLHLQYDRHGNPCWYVRRGKGQRIRIRGEYGSPEFRAAYDAALEGRKLEKSTRTRAGSLLWLYDRYQETNAWKRLSDSTRRQRENIFKGVMKVAGDQPYTALTSRNIEDSKEKRSDTPFQARNFLDAMRGLFKWAVKAGHASIDPTEGVENPKRPAGDGFPPWTEEDIARYEAKWVPGTRQRVWLHVLLYTGLRRGDAVRLGKQHVKDGLATIKTEKSRFTVDAFVPMEPELVKTLAEGPCGDLAFICGARGTPLVKEAFGNMFRDACKEAGVVGKSPHGVRKAAAEHGAENGMTNSQMKAIFAWKTEFMPGLYTKNADRKAMAKAAAGKLSKTGDDETTAKISSSRNN